MGAELVEKASLEKEEKARSRGLEDLAVSAPSVIEDFHKGGIQKIPDRDLELEKQIIELSHDFTKKASLEKEPVSEEQLPEFL